jgi:hypothetical protein
MQKNTTVPNYCILADKLGKAKFSITFDPPKNSLFRLNHYIHMYRDLLDQKTEREKHPAEAKILRVFCPIPCGGMKGVLFLLMGYS